MREHLGSSQLDETTTEEKRQCKLTAIELAMMTQLNMEESTEPPVTTVGEAPLPPTATGGDDATWNMQATWYVLILSGIFLLNGMWILIAAVRRRWRAKKRKEEDAYDTQNTKTSPGDGAKSFFTRVFTAGPTSPPKYQKINPVF